MEYQLFRVGNIWHYRFQINGTRVQRSTRETVKYRAAEIADRAYTRARIWARGDDPVPTLRELVVQWLEVHRPIVSRAHVDIVERFGRLHLFGLGDVFIDEITTELVEAARNSYLESHAAASANQWLNVLKLVCRWAIRRKVIPALPWAVKRLKLQKRPRAMLPVANTREWLAHIDELDSDDGLISIAVRLMLGIGLRESETITARWEWIDWSRASYTPGITKGREADPLPMPRWLIEYLQTMRRETGLIVARADGAPLCRGFTRRKMLAANEATGIGHITPHRLRGTFATLLSEEGAPVQTVQKALRHKNVGTTMAYLEACMDLVSRAQERIAENAGLNAASQSQQSGEEMAKSMAQTRTGSRMSN
ncbi:tyrosine-type recombinase/integrase [Trinickia dinghuensis]|uniref:Integrase n=1 Tax=Trinickia dinghuensis TaxID=2291023 RepID=A0A3D8K1U2_9BURK|nr:tyrosine-type recombinase/integrase [Trinickia dinghuensis]RDU99219.1 integrase [Trinickia dinghuensis]